MTTELNDASLQLEGEEDIPPGVMDLPAIFANGFYVTAESRLVRVAFSESTPGVSPVYRSAIMMDIEDARGLANLILRLTAETKASTPEQAP